MFKVHNADFIADKLANELLPNQEYREVLKNALEAVQRQMTAERSADGGRIEFDVDWPMLAATGQWFISCADNGDAMTRSQLERYTTTLAVVGAGQSQSLTGNQGMGLKISGPTRHKKGVLIRSQRGDERTMVQVGWNGQEYGLIPLGRDGTLVTTVQADDFPRLVAGDGHGTVVTFLGNVDGDNTFSPGDRPRGWLLKYLNTRFFRLSHDGIKVLVRVPSGDVEDWPTTSAEAAERMRGRGKSFNLTTVEGTAQVWDDAADRQGEEWRGTASLPGDPGQLVPPADVHWWVLPTGPGTDVSTRTASGGSLAVLYQNELHDWRTGNQANPYFARLGVLFGKTRIGFVIEPKGTTITSDFARAHVLAGGARVLESDSWLVWAEQFRADIPERIKQTMLEEQARLQAEDPDRIKRIRDRLRDVLEMLRPRRFRQTDDGSARATGPTVTGPGTGVGPIVDRPRGSSRQRTTPGRGIGAVLSQIDEHNGDPAIEVTSIFRLEPQWVTEREAEGFAIVNGNSNGLHDRAAALAGEDGRTASILLLNREFRGYQAILAVANEWANPEGDDDKTAKIETVTQEWVEQKMVESVQGLRQLENGSTWITEHYDEALSPVALTAAFMADRYHTLREIRRAVGSLRPLVTAAS